MSCSTRGPVLALAICCLAGAGAGASAARADGTNEPQVIASGNAQVLIPATNASFTIEISSFAASAAAASMADARLSKAVSSALEAAHLTRGELTRSRLTVSPRWEYDQATRRQKRTGYEAATTLQIETEHLDRVGTYIDAALDGGATGISGITFSATDSDEARHRALAEAVARAKADAVAMARASGGRLGELLLLTSEPQSEPRGVLFQPVAATAFRSPEAKTSLIPGQIEVSAQVTGRWRFLAGPQAQ
ncbi:MAG TPA: SIMPL domain-containing protein [Steroidobacteraceae bacterium]|nr:SIMPL domain-containing protein [Steroidobacteraceae bacterium]